jgi:hypothetical protein
MLPPFYLQHDDPLLLSLPFSMMMRMRMMMMMMMIIIIIILTDPMVQEVMAA